MNGPTRVVFNTGVLYVRLLVGMVMGLFTARLVLAALGEIDFGIYSLVAGVVGMLGILNSSMSSASMRFMAHSLGTGNKTIILKTFNTTLFLHIVIGLIVVFFIEIGGLVMFKNLLNIPGDRISDARIIFHFMTLTTFVTIISVPYDAVMNAHENILALSLIDMIGLIVNLGIAIYLTYSSSNLLVLYGLLILLTQILLRIIKQIYSKIKYDECKIRLKVYTDKKMMKTMMSYSGWNLFGNIASMSVTQVRSILLNMFFGVQINAAHEISKKASSQVNMISVSMTRALNPQLVKSEGSGNRQKLLHITELSTKFSVFLFALFAIPAILEVSYLLDIWLVEVPIYSVVFCQLILIGLLLEKFTFEVNTAIRAVGQIRNFQITEGFVAIFNIPIAYFLLKKGYPPYTIFIVSIFLALLGAIVRLYFGRRVANMDILKFFKQAIFPILIPVLLAALLAFLPQVFYPKSFYRLFFTTILSMMILTSSFWFWGLKTDETTKLKKIIVNILRQRQRLKV